MCKVFFCLVALWLGLVQPLEIIGAGFGRTGTKSLQAALDQIGAGPCYHATLLAKRHLFDGHLKFWAELGEGSSNSRTDGRNVDFDYVFGQEPHYRATVDFPSCMHFEKLMASYPEAKVNETRTGGRKL
jgi:hypothetical protein